jgi:hypothetical protein
VVPSHSSSTNSPSSLSETSIQSGSPTYIGSMHIGAAAGAARASNAWWAAPNSPNWLPVDGRAPDKGTVSLEHHRHERVHRGAHVVGILSGAQAHSPDRCTRLVLHSRYGEADIARSSLPLLPDHIANLRAEEQQPVERAGPNAGGRRAALTMPVAVLRSAVRRPPRRLR